MIRLGVNIDHVATVRQARLAQEPNPAAAALLAVLGGADGITVHLREDRRHIQDRDVRILRHLGVPRLNLEMAVAPEIVGIAIDLKPTEATLVPEKRRELTTEGGLDLVANAHIVGETIKKLKGVGIHVSVFIDPDRTQIDFARTLDADAIEFQTASYSEATDAADIEAQLQKLQEATAQAIEQGLHVHMGHGLNYSNVVPIVRIPGVEELNIGHSIVSRAVLLGMERAVRDMKSVIQQNYPHKA